MRWVTLKQKQGTKKYRACRASLEPVLQQHQISELLDRLADVLRERIETEKDPVKKNYWDNASGYLRTAGFYAEMADGNYEMLGPATSPPKHDGRWVSGKKKIK